MALLSLASGPLNTCSLMVEDLGLGASGLAQKPVKTL